MSKTLSMEDVLKIKNGESRPEDQRPNFKADTLFCKITTPDGTVVLECTMEPRGFKAKDTGQNAGKGGIGWYADVRGDDSGTYAGLPVSAGLRLSIEGVKVPVGQTVDLRQDPED